MEVIRLENAWKIYGGDERGVEALRGVSLSVREGESVAIIGSSGSGKSTLMNIIGCLDVPTRGSFALCGREVARLSEKKLSAIRRERVGFIFQGFNLIPTLTALENVELPLLYRGVPRSRRRELALAALDATGLSSRREHKPAELSGGQQQRVAIARAIAPSPPIILADEPTGNLDSRTGAEVLSLLRELNGNGHTLVVITHDMKVAAGAGRIIALSDGKIVEDA